MADPARAAKYKADKRARYVAKRKVYYADATKCCEICNRPFGPGKWEGPRWDHNHRTGQFRGWLCHQCNVALGLLQDSPELLRKAANYVESRG